MQNSGRTSSSLLPVDALENAASLQSHTGGAHKMTGLQCRWLTNGLKDFVQRRSFAQARHASLALRFWLLPCWSGSYRAERWERQFVAFVLIGSLQRRARLVATCSKYGFANWSGFRSGYTHDEGQQPAARQEHGRLAVTLAHPLSWNNPRMTLSVVKPQLEQTSGRIPWLDQAWHCDVQGFLLHRARFGKIPCHETHQRVRLEENWSSTMCRVFQWHPPNPFVFRGFPKGNLKKT